MIWIRESPNWRNLIESQALINPIIIFKVLSESTESFDRSVKFRYFLQIPSLKEYVLISQGHPTVGAYYRTDNNI